MNDTPAHSEQNERSFPFFSNPTHAAVFSLVINVALAILLTLFGNSLEGELKINFFVALAVIMGILFFIIAIALLIYAPEYYRKISSERTEIKKKSLDGYNAIRDLSEKTKNYVDDIAVHPIVMSTYSRELIFSNDILNTGNCQLHTQMTLINLHEHNTYKKFKTRLASHDAISCREQYKVYKETSKGCEQIELTDSNFKVYEHYQQSNGRRKGKLPENWECNITIPVGIEPNTTYPLHIRENSCPSFKKLKDISKNPEYLESVSASVNYPTDKLSFVIHLKEGELKDYILSRGGQADEDGDRESFKISDRSDQWLDHYCTRLKTYGYVPQYSDDNRTLTWIMPNPKQGYRYRLYFTLIKNPTKPVTKAHS